MYAVSRLLLCGSRKKKRAPLPATTLYCSTGSAHAATSSTGSAAVVLAGATSRQTRSAGQQRNLPLKNSTHTHPQTPIRISAAISLLHYETPLDRRPQPFKPPPPSRRLSCVWCGTRLPAQRYTCSSAATLQTRPRKTCTTGICGGRARSPPSRGVVSLCSTLARKASPLSRGSSRRASAFAT